MLISYVCRESVWHADTLIAYKLGWIYEAEIEMLVQFFSTTDMH